MTTNAEALFELCARTAQKERREEKNLQLPATVNTADMKKGCFGGFAERHGGDYSDYASISKYMSKKRGGEESVSEYENTSNKREEGSGWLESTSIWSADGFRLRRHFLLRHKDVFKDSSEREITAPADYVYDFHIPSVRFFIKPGIMTLRRKTLKTLGGIIKVLIQS